MFDDISQVTAGGVLALLIIREVLGFLKARKINGNGGGGGGKKRPITGGTGNPSVRIDLSDVESKLDRICRGIDDLGDAHAKMGRSLDDLAHSGDKTRQAIDGLAVSVAYLEKTERGRGKAE